LNHPSLNSLEDNLKPKDISPLECSREALESTTTMAGVSNLANIDAVVVVDVAVVPVDDVALLLGQAVESL
jgi:hypothetical protein